MNLSQRQREIIREVISESIGATDSRLRNIVANLILRLDALDIRLDQCSKRWPEWILDANHQVGILSKKCDALELIASNIRKNQVAFIKKQESFMRSVFKRKRKKSKKLIRRYKNNK